MKRSTISPLLWCGATAAALALVTYGQGIGKTALRRTKYAPPYQGTRATYSTRQRPGVYLIKQGSDLAYVGYSATDVYKALYRHFQTWNDPGRDRITYDRDAVTVRVIYTRTGRQAAELEKALILAKQPRDNPHKWNGYQLTTQEAAAIEAAEDAPFVASDDLAPF